MNAAKWMGAVLVVLGALVAPFLYWVHGNIALFALLISVVGFLLIFAARDRRAGAGAMGTTGLNPSGESRFLCLALARA
jgi:hypothetical protein